MPRRDVREGYMDGVLLAVHDQAYAPLAGELQRVAGHNRVRLEADARVY